MNHSKVPGLHAVHIFFILFYFHLFGPSPVCTPIIRIVCLIIIFWIWFIYIWSDHQGDSPIIVWPWMRGSELDFVSSVRTGPWLAQTKCWNAFPKLWWSERYGVDQRSPCGKGRTTAKNELYKFCNRPRARRSPVKRGYTNRMNGKQMGSSESLSCFTGACIHKQSNQNKTHAMTSPLPRL